MKFKLLINIKIVKIYETLRFKSSKFILLFKAVNNKGIDKTLRVHRLIYALVIAYGILRVRVILTRTIHQCMAYVIPVKNTSGKKSRSR